MHQYMQGRCMNLNEMYEFNLFFMRANSAAHCATYRTMLTKKNRNGLREKLHLAKQYNSDISCIIVLDVYRIISTPSSCNFQTSWCSYRLDAWVFASPGPPHPAMTFELKLTRNHHKHHTRAGIPPSPAQDHRHPA